MLSLQTLIQEMDDVTFKKHIEALATKRLEKPKKLSSQNSIYWGEIESQQYNFDRGISALIFIQISIEMLIAHRLTTYHVNLCA